MEPVNYEPANSMLRAMHLERRGRQVQVGRSVNLVNSISWLQSLPLGLSNNQSTQLSQASAVDQGPQWVVTDQHQPMSIRTRRSAAQRAHAANFLRPPKGVSLPAVAPVSKHSTTQLPYNEGFQKYRQQGIKDYRTAYNRRVNAHFDQLRSGEKAGPRSACSAPLEPIARLADEMAGRHVRPIKQYVSSEPSMPPSGHIRPPVSAARKPASGAARSTNYGL